MGLPTESPLMRRLVTVACAWPQCCSTCRAYMGATLLQLWSGHWAPLGVKGAPIGVWLDLGPQQPLLLCRLPAGGGPPPLPPAPLVSATCLLLHGCSAHTTHTLGPRHSLKHSAMPNTPHAANFLLLVCLQVGDVFSAAALKALLEALTAEGCVVVTTSNRHPADLPRHGLHEAMFGHFLNT